MIIYLFGYYKHYWSEVFGYLEGKRKSVSIPAGALKLPNSSFFAHVPRQLGVFGDAIIPSVKDKRYLMQPE